MAALGPFEARPTLAVAVSGGADSMALCLLADTWARERKGGALALIVDHRLRAGSADEAARTASRLAARDIDSEILVWSGAKPVAAIQARARQARYRLLADRCREQGVLHLLIGHHLEDQAETLMLRKARGSGAIGMAGMNALVETSCVRVLRPLLNVSKRRLRACLADHGQEWIEDPSNADPAFARTGVRAALAGAAAAPDAFARAAGEHRRLRQHRDEAVAALLASSCRLHPLGFVRLDAVMLRAADEATAEAALGRVAATVGGTLRPPAAEKLARLRRHLLAEAPKAASLGRCEWRWSNDPAGPPVILACREARGLPPPILHVSAAEVEWDGRFFVRIGAVPATAGAGLRLETLGESGWLEALRLRPALQAAAPRRAALTMLALYDQLGLLAVPGLDLYRDPAVRGMLDVGFRPRRGLSGSGYYLA